MKLFQKHICRNDLWKTDKFLFKYFNGKNRNWNTLGWKTEKSNQQIWKHNLLRSLKIFNPQNKSPSMSIIFFLDKSLKLFNRDRMSSVQVGWSKIELGLIELVNFFQSEKLGSRSKHHNWSAKIKKCYGGNISHKNSRGTKTGAPKKTIVPKTFKTKINFLLPKFKWSSSAAMGTR